MMAGLTSSLFAQTRHQEQPDMSLTPALRREVIDGTISRLNASYVFPEVAAKMEAAVRKHEADHAYDAITSAKIFADRLTSDLRSVSHDLHLHMVYSNAPFNRNVSQEPSPAEIEAMKKSAKSVNYGFEKLEILEGNVGYLSLRGFMSADLAGDTAAAAMRYLSNTDALIIDLRRNGGGDPEMVQVLCSYLFDQPTHLNDLYFRPDNSTRQYWSLPYVPGPRYVNKPVYVLTSKRTFSGAEEFTYNLKNLKRATIVGETTGGGAHPGGEDVINAHFAVWVPIGRAINPITKINWEGTGVKPDIETPEALALKTAQIDVLTKFREKATEPEEKARLSGAIDLVKKELEALKKG
jgi:C-terminal processing protease CtpA/Prc